VYVFATGTPSPERRNALSSAGIEVREVPDLSRVLDVLAQEQGVKRVLAEGGGELNAALFSEELVDELELTLCPIVIGGASAPTLVDGAGFAADELRRATLVSSETMSTGELFLRYRF
jgi:5-amino-6-(5-phosphoribosylamino)uracil reductase